VPTEEPAVAHTLAKKCLQVLPRIDRHNYGVLQDVDIIPKRHLLGSVMQRPVVLLQSVSADATGEHSGPAYRVRRARSTAYSVSRKPITTFDSAAKWHALRS
jgi:hypothetical protein